MTGTDRLLVPNADERLLGLRTEKTPSDLTNGKSLTLERILAALATAQWGVRQNEMALNSYRCFLKGNFLLSRSGCYCYLNF